mmetsp:Transcript_33461/g.100099  ORF Transcript_33461/g.100099 Transcript_33461/m.100099 type:complete len:117 (+) Transcript_33461:3-353(+)
MQGALLLSTSLEGINLNGPANLSYITVSNSSFRDAFLPGALLVGAHAPGIDFSGAYLQLAEFRGAHLEGGSFRKAQITDANFDWAYLDSTDFTLAVGRAKASWFGIRGSLTGLLVA